MKPQSKDERVPLCRACRVGEECQRHFFECKKRRDIWDDAIAWYRYEHDLCPHGRENGCCLDCSMRGAGK